jgi:hypothetical protein
MADVLRLPLSDAQRALARFREEERAFVAVLEVLNDWRREELFRRLFGVYRQRMRQLRKLAGALLDGVEAQPEAEELRRFARKRDRER